MRSRHRMVDEYEYQPLPDGESIRVLLLSPGNGDEPLSGVLKTIHLSNRRQTLHSAQRAHKQQKTSTETEVIRWTPEIPYEAISYVWGSDTKDHGIFLSGKTHRITNNLSIALQQCRVPDQSRALWADSICIDQDKLDEKSQQVYMMGRIYASSQRTLICLGHHNPDHALEASSLITNINQMLQETFHGPGFSWEPDCFPWPLPDNQLASDSRWQSIDVLLLHPWFSRGWVVQEAALGREAKILWADCQFAFSDVIRADLWYFHRVDQSGKHRETSTSILFRKVLHHRQEAESRVFFSPQNWKKDCDILYALHYARKIGLHDPRDRIFAFMALPFVRNPMHDLHPDYMQSHQEVYQDFAIKYLERTEDLNLLSWASRESHEESYDESFDSAFGSSWIPRWDHPHWTNDIHELPFKNRNFGQGSTERAEFMILLGGNGASASLQVRAVIFDSIRLVSPPFKTSTTVEELTTFWSYWSTQARSGLDYRRDQPNFDYESLAFLKALSVGYRAGATEEEWADELKSYSSFLWNSAQDLEPLRNPQVSPGIQICHRHLMHLAQNLNVFSLERGYYGLASPAIRQDDVCAFIFGVRSPIILRQVPDAGAHQYKVIGPAYIVSKHLNVWGIPLGLNRSDDWMNWNELRENEGLMDWGLKEEKIILL